MSRLLFELVKGMTLSEKGYFKRNANIHTSSESKNYLKIYEVIEKSKDYDKNTLSNHFKGTTIEKYQCSLAFMLIQRLSLAIKGLSQMFFRLSSSSSSKCSLNWSSLIS